MALSNAALEAAASAIAALGSWCSLHTADPSTTGASEKTAVARVQTTWTAGASDGVNTGSAVTFNAVPADTYKGQGVWNQQTVSGSTFVGGKSFPDLVLSAPANVTLTPRIAVTSA